MMKCCKTGHFVIKKPVVLYKRFNMEGKVVIISSFPLSWLIIETGEKKLLLKKYLNLNYLKQAFILRFLIILNTNMIVFKNGYVCLMV